MDREIEIVIEDLKRLIRSKGYIYTLCMIIFEDFHINPEKMQEINFRKRLNTKETSLLLGFLIQCQINFTPPDSWQDLMQMKQKTYELMEELHQAFTIPFMEKLQRGLEKEQEKKDFRKVRISEYPDGNSEGIRTLNRNIRTSYRINFYKTLFLINNYHLVHIKLKDLKEFNLKALLFFPIRLLYTHSDCSATPF